MLEAHTEAQGYLRPFGTIWCPSEGGAALSPRSKGVSEDTEGEYVSLRAIYLAGERDNSSLTARGRLDLCGFWSRADCHPLLELSLSMRCCRAIPELKGDLPSRRCDEQYPVRHGQGASSPKDRWSAKVLGPNTAASERFTRPESTRAGSCQRGTGWTLEGFLPGAVVGIS